MLRLVARADGAVHQFDTPAAEALLGSVDDNDIVLPVHGVSRRHALVTPRGGGLLFTDHNSKNGLIADGVRVPSVLLEPGRRIQIGRAVLTLEELESDFVPSALSAPMRSRTTSLFQARETALVRLIARLEGGVEPAAFEAIRDALGAAAFVWMGGRWGDVGILGAAGGAVDPELRAEVIDAALRTKKRDREVRRGVIFSSLRTAERTELVLAAYREPHRFAEWERELFGFVAARILRRAAEERIVAHEEPADDGLILHSPAMRAIASHLQALKPLDKPVLLLGETGTGKEVLARRLHRGGPFVAVNCALYANDTAAAQLFGVERGVFTGVDPRPGFFAAAEGGTLFLDEVGEMSSLDQAKVLRALEAGEYQPIGAAKPLPVRCRVVLATSKELRADLFYRCVAINVPPLRERREDIRPLALALRDRVCAELGKPRVPISEKALRLLRERDWPGNVRELLRTIEDAVLLHGEGTLHAEHFAPPAPRVEAARSLHEKVEALYRDEVEEKLRQAGGNRSEAARLLGISRNGLAKILERLTRS
jgi:transcriptional regulator with AAA-type ATPase domain